MNKIKFRFPAFILLTFVLGCINAGIVRAAESSSYRLETYGASADVTVGTSAGYSVQGSVDWTEKVLVGQHYQIVPGGDSSSTDAGAGAGALSGDNAGDDGGVGVPASRGDRAGIFSVNLPSVSSDTFTTSGHQPLFNSIFDSTSGSVAESDVSAQTETPKVQAPFYRQKNIERIATLPPFERSQIIETFTPKEQIPCLSRSTMIGCMTIAEATLLSRFSFLYRAEQAISSIPAFQNVARSAFTSSLLNVRAGSITLEGLFFPFGFMRRRKKKAKSQQTVA